MLYWLFTTGRDLAGYLLPPLLCLTPLILLAYLIRLGVGVRRSQSAVSLIFSRHRLLTHITLTLLVTCAFLLVTADTAVQSGRTITGNLLAQIIVGAPSHINSGSLLRFGVGLIGLILFANIFLSNQLKPGSGLRERIDARRSPRRKRGVVGSSHFCTAREYRRFRRADPDGVTLFGAFRGDHGQRLDAGIGQFCLNGEDAARGILTLGGPGSGKSQSVILPIIADHMRHQYGLIVADPQGELTPYVLRIAAVTGHRVIIHDPTRADSPRFNLADTVQTVADARAIADVLVPALSGDNRFWSDSAAGLLSACLLRFDTLGAVYAALSDLESLAQTLDAGEDEASHLAGSFIASVRADGKLAVNMAATLATALTGWADPSVQATTGKSDFSASDLISQPTVTVLTCPGRMRQIYAPYLGAVLRKLMLDLDAIGESCGGALPVPVVLVLDEFPALGKLDSMVTDVNLVRKRRISIVVAAQARGQFHLLYGQAGTEALFTGFATQIVFGGCDADTAAYYSRASGQATTGDDEHARPRPLLTPDEVQTPPHGNSLIFARYGDANFATQVVLSARLTRFYERTDWQEQLAATAHFQPHQLKRPINTDQPLTHTRPRKSFVKPYPDWRSSREQNRTDSPHCA